MPKKLKPKEPWAINDIIDTAGLKSLSFVHQLMLSMVDKISHQEIKILRNYLEYHRPPAGAQVFDGESDPDLKKLIILRHFCHLQAETCKNAFLSVAMSPDFPKKQDRMEDFAWWADNWHALCDWVESIMENHLKTFYDQEAGWVKICWLPNFGFALAKAEAE